VFYVTITEIGHSSLTIRKIFHHRLDDPVPRSAQGGDYDGRTTGRNSRTDI
jgi:hypothetical protein